MFEYTKTVLVKVSFSPALFCKELEKAVERLLPFELTELKIWLDELFASNPELKTCIPLLPK